MTPTLLFSLLGPIGIGFLAVFLLWPDFRPMRFHLLLRACLAVGFGFGLSFSLYFLGLLLGVSSRKGIILEEAVLGITLLGLLICRGIGVRKGSGALLYAPEMDSNRMFRRILLGIFAFELACAVAAFLVYSLQRPHGGWDAWSIWNVRARFIYRAGPDWRDAFSPLLQGAHADYPFLIPAMISRCWSYANHETVAAPMAVAMLFTFATLGLLWSSLSVLRSRSQGLLAGIVLVSTPFFIRLGALQYADVPLAFFILAALILLCLEDRCPESRQGLALLAGMAAGFSAWTKNEGFLFVLAVLVARGTVLVPVRDWKAGFRQMAFFLGGLAPLALLLLYFKTQVAPPNDLLSVLGGRSTLANLLDASRYVQTLKAFAVWMMKFGEWTVHPLPILALYLLGLGVRVERGDWRSVGAVLIALGLTLGGYFFTYIVTPYDLNWHLLQSLNRLLLQLWPSFVFLFFLVARCPEQALNVKKGLEIPTDSRGIAC